jgi:hypothetical protein
MARVREESPATDQTGAEDGATAETPATETAKPAAKAKPAAPRAKRVAPAVIRKDADVRSSAPGKEGSVVFGGNGVAHVEQGEVVVETNLSGINKKAAMLKFMEEPVTIIIAEASDKNAEKAVFCKVNGRGPGPGGSPWLPRNMEITIPRKYVEVLARARPVRVQSVEKVNNETGERYMEQNKSSSDRYPFSVVQDANPAGREWLRSIRANRAG